MDRLKNWWAHAFAVDSPTGEFSAQDREMVERLARWVVGRGLSAPALMALETGRPLNFVGSQVLVFLSPLLTQIFSPTEYDRFVRILEKRQSIDLIVEAITAQENTRDG